MFLIILLTIILVLNCLLLGLLIMIQLPKKEAGVGIAFGGGATDALFGAGSGTALTKLTKYSATSFFVLVLLLCILNSASRSSESQFRKQLLEKQAGAQTQAPAAATTAAPATGTNAAAIPLTITTNSIPSTKAPATALPTTTNAPAAPK